MIAPSAAEDELRKQELSEPNSLSCLAIACVVPAAAAAAALAHYDALLAIFLPSCEVNSQSNNDPYKLR